jgi:hypothetical protein
MNVTHTLTFKYIDKDVLFEITLIQKIKWCKPQKLFV